MANFRSSSSQAPMKKVARGLLESLKKEKLVLDWRKRQQSRAAVLVTIGQALDVGLRLPSRRRSTIARPPPFFSTSTTATTAPARACTPRWREGGTFPWVYARAMLSPGRRHHTASSLLGGDSGLPSKELGKGLICKLRDEAIGLARDPRRC